MPVNFKKLVGDKCDMGFGNLVTEREGSCHTSTRLSIPNKKSRFFIITISFKT